MIKQKKPWPIKEGEFKSLIENLNDGVLMVTGDGEILYMNKYCLKMLGYKKSEILQKNAWDIIHPSELEKIQNLYKRRVSGKSAPDQYETLLIKKNNESIPVEFRVSMGFWQEKPISHVIIRDVSRRKKAELKYKKLTKNPSAVIEVARDGTILFANEGAKPILDYWSVKMGEALPKEWQKNITDLIKKGENENFELEINKKTFSLNFVPIDREAINIYGLNISKTKHAEKKLQKALNRFTFHIKNTPLIYIEWSKDFKIIEWNPQAEKIFGFKKHEVLNKKPENLIFSKKNRDYANDFFRSMLENENSSHIVAENINKKGEELLCEWYNTPLKNENNEKIGVTSLVRDITEEQKKEKNLKLLSFVVEQINEGIAMANFEGTVLFCNEAFAKMHGMKPKDTINKNISIFYNKEQLKEIYKIKKTVIKNGSFSGEVWNQRKNGEIFPAIMQNAIIRDEIGTPIGIVATLQDITNQKKVEGEKNQYLERINEIKMQWEKTVDSLPHIICLVDRDERVVQINKTIEKWKLGKVETSVGQKLQEVLCPAKYRCKCLTGKLWQEAWEKVQKGSAADLTIHHHVLKRTLYMQIQPIFKSDNKKREDFTVVIIYDITEEENIKKKMFDLYRHLGIINRRISILLNFDKAKLTSNEQETLNSIAKSAQEISQADICFLYKYQKEDHSVKLIAASKDVEKEQIEEIREIKVDNFPCLKELFEKKARVQGLTKEHKISKLDIKKKLKSFAIFPIIQKDEIKGVLFLGFKNKDQITTQDLAFYNLFVNHVGLVLEI